MPSPFSARDARVSGAIDRAFGESFAFSAFTKVADVNLPPAPDVARPDFTITGVFENTTSAAHLPARGVPDESSGKRVGSMPSVSISDADLPWVPRRGDRVVRAFDGAKYEISSVMPDGMGRITVFLTARK